MSELTQLSLIAAADGIRQGQFSSRELVEATLGRIERLGPTLNCFIDVWAERALAGADQADELSQAKAQTGPLHGVPLAHKDMFYRAGTVCTCGSKIRRDFVPNSTATVLERLDAAGALHIGALNMSEFAFGPTGHNAHFGPARNPWNTDHISGGSSSGSGVSVAARLVFAALGSDTGGSVRLPAAASGIVGLKPTQTRVSRFGAMGLSFSLDNVGPLTRTVADSARMLGVIAGLDSRDGTSSAQPVPDYEAATRDPDIRGLKIGRPRNYYFDLVTPDVAAAMERALATFSELGAEIVDITVPDHDHIGLLQGLVSTSEAATLHGAWLRERARDYGPQVRARIEPGLATTATHYLSALQARPLVVERFVNDVFSQCDMMFTPVFSMPQPRIDETDVGDSKGFHKVLAKITRCTAPINYLTFPGLSLPGELIDGLPTSFQLVGRPFAEPTLFRAGAAYEAASEFSTRVPTAAALD
ncbi:MAG: aspartyl-tRNA(Asn)/glutamyl-tRNA(Gln) amidotransferase subunit A [Gammaproteobacteria bacterium]